MSGETVVLEVVWKAFHPVTAPVAEDRASSRP